MKEVKIGDDKTILLVKSEGGFYALGAKCTHYGAPLVKGNVANGHVRCPWHGACFNLETGTDYGKARDTLSYNDLILSLWDQTLCTMTQVRAVSLFRVDLVNLLQRKF